jgi:hypothetical protein
MIAIRMVCKFFDRCQFMIRQEHAWIGVEITVVSLEPCQNYRRKKKNEHRRFEEGFRERQ